MENLKPKKGKRERFKEFIKLGSDLPEPDLLEPELEDEKFLTTL